MNLPRAISKTFGTRLLNRAASLVATSFFANELGASILGTYFLFQMLLNVVGLTADWGIKDGVEKRLSENNDRSDILATALVLKAALLVAPTTAIYVFRGFFNDYLGADLAVIFVGVLVLSSLENFTMKVLRGELKIAQVATLHLTRHYVRIIVGVVLVWLGYDLIGLIASLVVSSALVLAWGWYKRDTPVGRFSAERARSLVDFAKYDFAGSIGGRVYNWLDVALIGFFIGPGAVGAYEVAWRISSTATMLSGTVRSSMFPQISAWSANDDHDEIRDVIPDVLTLSLLFVVPSLFGAILLGEEVLRLVFGPEFATAALVLVVLMGEKVIQAVHTVISPILSGMDRPDLNAKAVAISTSINLVLNVALILEFGIIGAAVATLLSSASNFLFHYNYVVDLVAVEFPLANIRAMVLSALGMTAVLWVVLHDITVDTMPALFAFVGVGCVLYVAFVLTASSVRRTLGEFVREAADFSP